MNGTLSQLWRRRVIAAAPLRRRWLFGALLMMAGAVALPAAASEFALAPGQTVVGQLQRYTIKQGEVFGDIARHFDVGYTELVEANPGIDPWLAPPGTVITIPSLYILPAAPHRGIVLNLAQYRLFYFPPGGNEVYTFPVGVGVIGWSTPIGTTTIVRKEPHPVWIPPASMRRVEPNLPKLVPPGPDNPLGDYALHLGWPRDLIHGTDRPDGVGRNVSHGCVHMYPEDIAQLFRLVHVGTAVRTLDEPASAAWSGNLLYLTVHPSQKQVQEIDIEEPVTPAPESGVRRLVTMVAGQYAAEVDWPAADRAAEARTNMPVVVADTSALTAAPPPPMASQAMAPQPLVPQAMAPQPLVPPQMTAPQQSAEAPAGPGTARDFGREVEQAYRRALEQQRERGAEPPPFDGSSERPDLAGAPPPTAAMPQDPEADPAQAPEQAEQSFERAMQSFGNSEQSDNAPQ